MSGSGGSGTVTGKRTCSRDSIGRSGWVLRAESERVVSTVGNCTNSLEKLLTVRELADVLKLHAKTVERMARDGRVPSVRVCGRVRFKPSDIASWLAEREDRTCRDC